MNNTSHVKFVSYDGKWPCLCYGELVLEIDGELVEFGKDSNNESFWESGGTCGFYNGYCNDYCEQSEWIINASLIPERYKKYECEIDKVFNENVEHGCCGGCL